MRAKKASVTSRTRPACRRFTCAGNSSMAPAPNNSVEGIWNVAAGIVVVLSCGLLGSLRRVDAMGCGHARAHHRYHPDRITPWVAHVANHLLEVGERRLVRKRCQLTDRLGVAISPGLE